MKRTELTQESGFTLVELLVVILIIGILAAIAIPVFLNQRKQAAIASVQSDLKNAALSMESEAVSNKGKYLSYVPNYNPRSAGVRVALDNVSSSEKKFCLIGKSEVYKDILYTYDSTDGGILGKGKTCGDVPAGDDSFSTVLAGKKALIVYARGSDGQTMSDAGSLTAYLKAYGFGTVDAEFNADPSKYANYDVIIARGYAWSVEYAVYQNLVIGYAKGAHILTDGDDATSLSLPNFIKKSESRGSGGASSFTQTGATGLNPPFPYTYNVASFANNTWVCAQEMQPGVVVIADSDDPKDTNNKCVTAAGLSNGNSRWINITKFLLAGDTSMSDSSLNWLTTP